MVCATPRISQKNMFSKLELWNDWMIYAMGLGFSFEQSDKWTANHIR